MNSAASPAHRPRVAVVGAGISGLAAAYALAPTADVVLFEGGSHFGGHANTVDVTLQGITHGVDTGFLVFNERTYPKLIKLFAELAVPTAPSDMSFSVQWPAQHFEWCGSDLNGVFAQRSNLLKPAFWRMLAEVRRFNAEATAVARGAPCDEHTVGEFLDRRGYSSLFCNGYFMPMVACIWSCPAEQMRQYPLRSLLQFCDNHGLLQLTDRPAWHTVVGGSREYVRRMLAKIPQARLQSPVRAVRRASDGPGALVTTDGMTERFDEVVLACHTDQALALLADPTPEERAVLGAIHYQRNRAVLHTDVRVLPRRKRAWAAWNYEAAADVRLERRTVCLHYLINRLQPVPFQQPVVVSLNPLRQPRGEHVLAEFDYEHPVFDATALAAQQQLGTIQGGVQRWFCGAWAGHGFHEDGLAAGLAVAEQMTLRLQHAAHGLRRVA